MKVAEAASRYMDDKRGRLRACTLAGYESALALHVLPRWGELELESITPEGVQGWIDSFELPGAAEKAYKTLRQVIRWAIRRLGVRMYDPTAAGVELPHKPAHRPRTMEASQVRAYLRALWGHECEAVAICSVTLHSVSRSFVSVATRGGEIQFARIGGLVAMNLYNVTARISGSWSGEQIGTVPEGFRPKNQLRQRCVVANSDREYSAGLWIKPSGEMFISNFGGTGLSGQYSFSCCVAWPA